ncbi:hypothetical protein [Verrucomicrobium spinosum]|uniref:hypothetical protein n=1 Tax=Verrucomicrobium spinosum TaxID=2736 RepID=UPI0012F62A06|nr:hypothetical protein [Verrucomicrobium spinosum]
MFLTNLDILINRIKDAEYAHLLLEPVPLFGLLFGLIFFAVGLWGREDKTRVIALLVIAGACASVIPYTTYRERAQPRVLEMMPLKKSIKDQTALRQNTQWVYLTVAGIAILALISSGKIGQLAGYGVLVTGLGALVFSIWLHMKEAEIFHPNIRGAPTKVIPAAPVKPAKPVQAPVPAASATPAPATPATPAKPQ